MITDHYIKTITEKGKYKAARSHMYLWYGIATIVVGIILPVVSYLIVGELSHKPHMYFWIGVMQIIGFMMIFTDRKAPNMSLTLDFDGITYKNEKDEQTLLWQDINGIFLSESQLSVPNKKNFNFVAKKNKYLNVQLKDGAFKSWDLNGIAYNPLKLMSAINALSKVEHCDPKGEEKTTIKNFILATIAIVGIIAFVIVSYM